MPYDLAHRLHPTSRDDFRDPPLGTNPDQHSGRGPRLRGRQAWRSGRGSSEQQRGHTRPLGVVVSLAEGRHLTPGTCRSRDRVPAGRRGILQEARRRLPLGTDWVCLAARRQRLRSIPSRPPLAVSD